MCRVITLQVICSRTFPGSEVSLTGLEILDPPSVLGAWHHTGQPLVRWDLMINDPYSPSREACAAGNGLNVGFLIPAQADTASSCPDTMQEAPSPPLPVPLETLLRSLASVSLLSLISLFGSCPVFLPSPSFSPGSSLTLCSGKVGRRKPLTSSRKSLGGWG